MVRRRDEVSPSLVSGPVDVSVDEVTVGPPSRSILGMRVDATSYHVEIERSFAPYVWTMLIDMRGSLA